MVIEMHKLNKKCSATSLHFVAPLKILVGDQNNSLNKVSSFYQLSESNFHYMCKQEELR